MGMFDGLFNALGLVRGDLSDVYDLVAQLRRDHDEHVIRTKAMVRAGPVKKRDHDKGVVIGHGTDDDPDDSPYVQPSERSGVERDLPREGEMGCSLAPYGDPEQGTFFAWGHTDAKANPAKGADETVHFNRDGMREASEKGTRKLETGKVALTTTPDSNTVKTAKASVTTGPAKHTVMAENTKLEADGNKVLAAAKVFRATEKVILASG